MSTSAFAIRAAIAAGVALVVGLLLVIAVNYSRPCEPRPRTGKYSGLFSGPPKHTLTALGACR